MGGQRGNGKTAGEWGVWDEGDCGLGDASGVTDCNGKQADGRESHFSGVFIGLGYTGIDEIQTEGTATGEVGSLG